jgi:hypothetical protein
MYQGVFCCETQLEYLTQTSPEVSQKTSVVWYPTELDDLLACDGIPNIWEWFLHWKYMFFFPLLTFLVHNDCIFSTRTGTASRFQVWRSINYSQHRCSMCQWSNDHQPSIILPSFFHADEISISYRLCLAPGHASCVAAHPRLRAIQGHKHCWLSPDYGIDEDNDG